MNGKIKFAVVGCGHIGRRHIEMINKNSNAELAALIDLKPADQLNLKVKDVPFFTSLPDFLKAGIPTDVINIATPNSLHAAQAIECLDMGKHVVVEKPMALSKGDAEKIMNTALQVHKHVFVVMQNRFSPTSIWIKDLVKSGQLGKIYMVQLNCYWNRDDRYYSVGSWHGKKDLDGGVLFTQFSHFIDILYWLFGDIDNINARTVCHSHKHSTEFEDSGVVLFDFIKGGTGCLSFSTSVWDKNLEVGLTIIAENGSVKIGGQYLDKLEYCHVKNYLSPTIESINSTSYSTSHEVAQNHSCVIQNVIEVLNGHNSISTNALEGTKVVEIIERIYNSSKN